jgi:hypothetical protein
MEAGQWSFSSFPTITGNYGRGHEFTVVGFSTRNGAVIHQVTRSCYPKAGQFDSLAIDALVWLRGIAAYGEDGQSAGQDLLPFLSSKNGNERALGITTLAAIGYNYALPQIEVSNRFARESFEHALREIRFATGAWALTAALTAL